MKKWILILLLPGSLMKGHAQAFELQQLVLDIGKLSEMKRILSDMKTGYYIVSKGYTAVRDITQGNFNLHKVFLDGLWLVSPAVRKYWKIPAIINYQVQIVKQYQSAFNSFKQAGLFNPDEITYMGKVYSSLLNQSLKNITDLTTVITANQVRMSDAERLQMIDRIYADMQDKVMFLNHFNNNNSLLGLQRWKGQNDMHTLRQMNGIKASP